MFTCYNISTLGSMFYPFKRYSVQNSSLLNSAACNVLPHLNRTGRFCGKCMPGFGLAVYSYDFIKCIPCQDFGLKNWLKFFAAALLPLTVFYFMVIIFRISFTSSHLTGLVFVLQNLSSPLLQRTITGMFYSYNIANTNNFQQLIVIKAELIIYGVFNLDFFRATFPDVCLHPEFNILHVLSLDFLVALYPFVLIALTYILIHLHDNKCQLVVWAWKPFQICLKKCQVLQNIRTSPAEIFATFILLANVKLLGVCSDLLLASRAYGTGGEKLENMFLLYDASIGYFSSEHIPYAVLALCTGFLFVLVPFLLLLLYPCRCFHKLLNFLNLQSHTLHIFMDAFQGSYKIQPYDMRPFSAYYLFLRFLQICFVAVFQSAFWVPVNAMVIVVSAVLIAIFQPYKNGSHNTRDVVLLLLLAFVYMAYTGLILTAVTCSYWLIVAKILVIISASAMLIANGAVLVRWKCIVLPVKKIWAKCSFLRNYGTSHIDDILDGNNRLTNVNESSSLIICSQ